MGDQHRVVASIHKLSVTPYLNHSCYWFNIHYKTVNIVVKKHKPFHELQGHLAMLQFSNIKNQQKRIRITLIKQQVAFFQCCQAVFLYEIAVI